MKTLVILIILVLNGCQGRPIPCEPVPCTKQKCTYEKLPTYKVPPITKITKPKVVGNGMCLMKISDVLLYDTNNKKLRDICWKYAVINKKLNSSRL